MKKKLLSLIIFVLNIFSMFLLSGCDFGLPLTDEKLAKKNMEELIQYIDNEDRDAIRELFAPNKKINIENFDESIDELLSYFKGDYQSLNGSGPVTIDDKHNGRVIKYHDMSHDVTTTVNVYRIAIRWCVKDTGNSLNIGIWSFYILDFDADPNEKYSYWGDGLWSSGIHIGKIYEDDLD